MRTGGLFAALKTQKGEVSDVIVPNTKSSTTKEYILYLDMTAGMYGVT